jgi:hypothetical protein
VSGDPRDGLKQKAISMPRVRPSDNEASFCFSSCLTVNRLVARIELFENILHMIEMPQEDAGD